MLLEMEVMMDMTNDEQHPTNKKKKRKFIDNTRPKKINTEKEKRKTDFSK